MTLIGFYEAIWARIFLAVLIRFRRYIGHFLHCANENDGAVTAIATSIIAVFTALLVITAYLQWQSAKSSHDGLHPENSAEMR